MSITVSICAHLQVVQKYLTVSVYLILFIGTADFKRDKLYEMDFINFVDLSQTFHMVDVKKTMMEVMNRSTLTLTYFNPNSDDLVWQHH